MKESNRFEPDNYSLSEQGSDESDFGEFEYRTKTYFGKNLELDFSAENESDIDLKFGKTVYLPIQLSKKVLPKVGVFIPNNLQSFSAINIIVFFHGHIYPCDKKGVDKFDKGGIEYYWNTSGFKFLREELAASGRKALLIAPTFTNKLNREAATYGNLNANNKFDFLINECFSRLKKDNLISNSAKPQNIILAGHSGGGLPMQAILWAKNSLGQNIVECWGFESLYFGTDIWWSWLNFKPDNNFIHYRRQSQFVNQTELLRKHYNFQDVKDGKGHCSLVKEKWKNSIENCRWLQTGTSQKMGIGITTDTELADFNQLFEAEFSLEKSNLYKRKIVVAKIPENKEKREKAKRTGGAYVEIKESPSVFLIEIIRRAQNKAHKDKKNDIAAKLNPSDWFNQFTKDFTFIGRKLKPGQFVHIEMAKLLKTIETKFITELNITDARKAGDILLKNSTDLNNNPESISGSRLTSSTATFSMHMFGLAVDVNYLGNPYIEDGDIKPMNNVLKNASDLMNTKLLTYKKHIKNNFADRFDYIQALDDTIENYFKLLDDSAMLNAYLKSTNSSEWQGLEIKEAAKKIQKNLDNLAGYLARSKSDEDKPKVKIKDYFKKNAILNFDKRFVSGMERNGLHWGGDYGDMMHFDMRKTGVGYYIEKARLEYAGQVKNQAERLFKEKNYGEHSPG